MTDLQKPMILTEVKDRVLTIRMNRADKKNALTQSMYVDLAVVLREAAVNTDVRVALITGSGDAFTSGNDIADFMKAGGFQGDHRELPVSRFMQALLDFPKPVVAAVNGPAIGIGTTLLLHCDLIYAGESSRLQMPFVNLGICAEFASSFVLPRLMGHPRAAELLLLGEPFNAQHARACGIVNAVLPDAEVLPHAQVRALQLASQPPGAVRTTKALLKRWERTQIEQAMHTEEDHFIPMLGQPEATEAMTAFMTKRKPDFSRFS